MSATPKIDVVELIERIQPRIDAVEQERGRSRARLIRNLVLIAAAAVILALVVLLTDAGFGLALLPLILALVAGLVLLQRAQKHWSAAAQKELVPLVCESISDDLEYRNALDSDDFVAPFDALDLVGSWSRADLAHLIRGRHHQTRFEMVHATLERVSRDKDSNDSTSTVFHGLLGRVELPMSVDPGFSIRPNFGWFIKKLTPKTIPTGDAEFDETFLVTPERGAELDSSQVEAVLTPEWRRALLAINAGEGRQVNNRPALAAGFKYDSFYFSLSRYEVGRALGPIKTERARPFLDVGHVLARESRLVDGVETMVDDVCVIHRIIDRLRPVLRG